MKPPEVNNRHVAIGRVASLGPSGESVQTEPLPLPLASESCLELLPGLNNAFAVILMNAQALDSKLPSYSRTKRYIHEIERSAQRGSALLKRLLDRFPADASNEGHGGLAETIPPVAERIAVVANQGPNAAEGVLNLASSAAHAAPAFTRCAHRTV
jgi:hypothetical protein